MASICPFKGIYYNKKMFSGLEEVIAPPYDVVDEKERDAIVKKSPHNVFSLELPSKESCNGEAADKYQCAAILFNKWLKSGVLIQDNHAGIYPYDIEYQNGGKTRVRKGFICLVRADDWEKRTVLPHERTFSKVTQDRFLLRSATKAQFSQIFMIYRHNRAVTEALEGAEKETLFQVTDPKGAIHTLSRISEKEVLEGLKGQFNSMQLYIADGHHRYTTAIRYRKEMEAKYGLGPDAPYNFTMAYLVDAEDSGLIVLPTHRLLNLPDGMGEDEVRERLSRYFLINSIELSETAGLVEQAYTFEDVTASTCSQGISVMLGKSRQSFVLCPKDEAKRELMESVGHRELADLDVVVLEELVFKRALGIDPEGLEAGKDIFFVADSEKALECLGSHQVLFFMHPTKVEQVLNVADAGLCMPHKSTFFYPKILTGMVMNKEDF